MKIGQHPGTVGIFYVESMRRNITKVYDWNGNITEAIVESVACDFVATVSGGIITKGTATFADDLPGSFEEAERMIREYWAKGAKP